MLKYILLVGIVVVCGFVGYLISSIYSKRTKFYAELILFCEKMQSDINFSRNKLSVIIKNHECKNKDFKIVLNKFLEYLEGGKELLQTEMFEQIKILKDEEKANLFQFFVGLGKLDVFNEVIQVENSKERFQVKFKECEAERKKYGTVYMKLGVILGLLIILILY